MKKRTRMLVILLVMLLVASVLPIGASAANSQQTTAVNYILSLEGTPHDVDGTGYDCVDLAKMYFRDIGGKTPQSIVIAANYAKSKYDNALPDGWVRKYYSNGYRPQPGDVAVWDGDPGHVALIYAVHAGDSYTIDCMEQNTSTQAAAKKHTGYDAAGTICYIVPTFNQDSIRPTVSDCVAVSNVSKSGFTLTFDADDNVGVTSVWADVRPGSSDATPQTIQGIYNESKKTATVQVDTNEIAAMSGSSSHNYYVTCYVADGVGNWAAVDVEHERISVYPVEIHSTGLIKTTGTFKTTQETAGHYEPCEEIDGKPTETFCYAKGTSVSGVGVYTNQWGATYLLTASGDWLYSDHLRYQMQWSDIWDAISSFFNGNVTKIVYFAGQPLAAVNDAPVKLFAASGTPNSIKLYGNVLTGSAASGSYTVPSYKVYFDANGGSVSSSYKKVFFDSPYGTLPTPYRLGYRFDGWFTLAEGGSKVDASSQYILSSDSTLYAHWTRIILLNNVKCGDNLYVTLYGDGEMIVTGSGAMTSHPWTASSYAERVVTVSLPAEMTAFCTYAFQNCTYLQEINIPDVTVIPEYCFWGCKYMGWIDLPETITSIDNYAFQNSGANFALPSQLTTLGYEILDGNTGVKSINIPATLSSVASYIYNAYSNDSYSYRNNSSSYQYGPFTGSSIEAATMESGKTLVDKGLFANADHLKTVSIPNTVETIDKGAFYGTDALESISIPNSVTTINEGVFAYSGLTSLTLPSNLHTLGAYILNGNTGVKSILLPNTINEMTEPTYWSYPGPFYGSGIETAELQTGSTRLYSYCFNGADKLQRVTLPTSLTEIGSYAFQNCTVLVSADVPNNVTRIGDYAYYNCKALQQISLSTSLTSIEDDAFAYTGLQSLTLPSYLTTLGYNILDGNTGVKSINIPATLSSVASYIYNAYSNDSYSYRNNSSSYQYGPFTGSSIEAATMESGKTLVDKGLFANADHLKTVSIPNTVEVIDKGAFYGTDALESISIPNSVTTINEGVFAYSGFSSIEGGENLKTIGNYAFHYSALEEFLLDANLESFGSSVFTGCSKLRTVKIGTVPAGTFSGCTTLESVVIGDTATSIGESAFSGCTSLQTVSIGENVTTINASAFSGCTALQTVSMGENVTTINASAFRDCTALTTLTLGEKLKSIGDYAFYNCIALTGVTMPDTVTSVGSYAFCGCRAMEECILSASLQSIGNYAFSDCDGLTGVEMPNTVTTLGNHAYYDCDGVKTIVLSNALRTIEEYTFAHCDSLQSVEIPYRVTSLGNYAFQQDVSLRSVQIPRSVESIGTEAFNYPDRLTIYGITGTYAETWANANHFRFNGNEVHAAAVSITSELTLERGSYANLTLNVTPADFTDSVVWKSADESVVTVDADGRVYAKNIGTAIVRVAIGEDGMGANCLVTVVPPSSSVSLRVSLNYSTRTLEALETYTLKATTSASSNATLEGVTWSSSDENVAKVDANGVVTGYGKGSAVITATARTTGGVTATASCTVTVTGTAHFADSAAQLQSPHNYACDCRDVWVYTHPDAETLTLTFDERTNIEDSFDYLYIYDGTGAQVGKYTGTALAGESITISGDAVRIKLVSDASGVAWGFAVTNIEPYVFVPVAAQGISFKSEYINLALNANATLVPIFNPLGTTNQEVTWSSSNRDVVSVSKDGVICGIGSGTAVITATAEDGGFTASVTVRVSEASALGDVNNDGEVDSTDAMITLRSCVNLVTLTDAQKAAADVNGDGSVDIGDAVLILRYDVGYIRSFPAAQK